MMSNDQYKKAIKIAIKEESRNQLREKLFESSKLIYLAGWDQAMGPQMMMTDLQRIQSFTRFRLNCQCIFSADFGSGYRWKCGELDTLGHIRRGCPHYSDILPREYEAYSGTEEAEALYGRILGRREQLGEERARERYKAGAARHEPAGRILQPPHNYPINHFTARLCLCMLTSWMRKAAGATAPQQVNLYSTV